MTADDLVAEYIKLDDLSSAASKAYAEKMKPTVDRMEEIKNQLLGLLNEQGSENIKTQHGTAYKSIIVTPKAVDKVAYLDWCLDNWEAIGNEMLQIGAPQKAALEQYRSENDGQLPPHVAITEFTRLNIRRS